MTENKKSVYERAAEYMVKGDPYEKLFEIAFNILEQDVKEMVQEKLDGLEAIIEELKGE